jgi:two-component system, response regulator
MDVKKEFGAVVKSKRNRLGLSQEALAERADLHRTYITDIERGTRNLTLGSIAKLAAALGVSIGALFAPDIAPDAEKGNGAVDILLVEDNPRDVELTLEAFKQAKCTNHIHVVRDGEEALDFIFCKGKFRSRLMEAPPQAILLDLNLPKINGLEVLRRLKSDKRSLSIKVVVLSGSRLDEDLREAIQLGAAGYIVKPVDFHNFSQITPKLDLWWALFKSDGPAGVGRATGSRPG